MGARMHEQEVAFLADCCSWKVECMHIDRYSSLAWSALQASHLLAPLTLTHPPPAIHHAI